MYELFTLGDEGPRNNTETHAIFAGTGSEIKLGKQKLCDDEKLIDTKEKPKKVKKLKRRESAKEGKDIKFLHSNNSTLERLKDKPKEEQGSNLNESKAIYSKRDVWSIGEVDYQGKSICLINISIKQLQLSFNG